MKWTFKEDHSLGMEEESEDALESDGAVGFGGWASQLGCLFWDGLDFNSLFRQ